MKEIDPVGVEERRSRRLMRKNDPLKGSQCFVAYRWYQFMIRYLLWLRSEKQIPSICHEALAPFERNVLLFNRRDLLSSTPESSITLALSFLFNPRDLRRLLSVRTHIWSPSIPSLYLFQPHISRRYSLELPRCHQTRKDHECYLIDEDGFWKWKEILGRVRAHDLFSICSVRFLFAAYFFCLRLSSVLLAACLFCLQRFFLICSDSFFVCSVSFLFATFLFCLQRVFFVIQRVPCGPS